MGEDENRGVRGWLLLLVLWLIVYMPGFNVGFLILITHRMREVNPLDAAMMSASGWDTIMWANVLSRGVIYVTAGLLLVKMKKAFVPYLVAGLIWLAGPLTILVMPMFIEGTIAIPGLVRSAIIALIWTLYLMKSERVANTYGKSI